MRLFGSDLRNPTTAGVFKQPHDMTLVVKTISYSTTFKGSASSSGETWFILERPHIHFFKWLDRN